MNITSVISGPSYLRKTCNSNQSLVNRNAELSLLFQLEQRKVRKLEEENRSLLERIQSLTTKKDEQRLQLLVADKTKRKLIQLKAITKRTILSLQSGINEFNTFVKDVDEAIEHESNNGALNMEFTHDQIKPDPRAFKFCPTLNRIPESPIISSDPIILLNNDIGLQYKALMEEPTKNLQKEDLKENIASSLQTTSARKVNQKIASPDKLNGLNDQTALEKANNDCNVLGFDTSLNFEDALSYSLNFAAKNTSALNSECNPSFISSGEKMRPLYTSTPKTLTPFQRKGISRFSTDAQTKCADKDGFVVPHSPRRTKFVQRKAKTIHNEKKLTLDAPSLKGSTPISESPNHENSRSEFVFDPQVMVNITSRRNTNYSRCSDSSVVSEPTVIECEEQPTTNNNKQVLKSNKLSDDYLGSFAEDEKTFVHLPQAKRICRPAPINVKEHGQPSNDTTEIVAEVLKERPNVIQNQPDQSTLSASTISEGGRHRRAAAMKVTSYKLPSSVVKLRRDF